MDQTAGSEGVEVYGQWRRAPSIDSEDWKTAHQGHGFVPTPPTLQPGSPAGTAGSAAADLVAELEGLERQWMTWPPVTEPVGYPSGRSRRPQPGFSKSKSSTSKLGPLTSTAVLEPYAGRRGILRQQWPTLSVDEQRAIIGATLGRVEIPAGEKGRATVLLILAGSLSPTRGHAARTRRKA